jgi:hypothetical protein
MATYLNASVTAVSAKHSGGVPKSCSTITDTIANAEAQPPNGGLFGSLFILSPAGGGMFSQEATALANFERWIFLDRIRSSDLRQSRSRRSAT